MRFGREVESEKLEKVGESWRKLEKVGKRSKSGVPSARAHMGLTRGWWKNGTDSPGTSGGGKSGSGRIIGKVCVVFWLPDIKSANWISCSPR